MIVRLPCSVIVSMITPMFGSSVRTRKMPLPPMPSSGLKITSPCSARNSRSTGSRLVTSVGGANCGKRATASFSLKSRMVRGSFTTRAPWRAASSSRWVAYRYSLSNGGSLRISTMSKSDSGLNACAEASNQSHGSAPGAFRETVAA